jgi:hypothetical protein
MTIRRGIGPVMAAANLGASRCTAAPLQKKKASGRAPQRRPEDCCLVICPATMSRTESCSFERCVSDA